jgi:hypothetical protein
MLYQFSVHGIPVHIVQFFFQFLLAPHVEVIEAALPEGGCCYAARSEGQLHLSSPQRIAFRIFHTNRQVKIRTLKTEGCGTPPTSAIRHD